MNMWVKQCNDPKKKVSHINLCITLKGLNFFRIIYKVQFHFYFFIFFIISMEKRKLHWQVFSAINSYRRNKRTSDANASKNLVGSGPFDQLMCSANCFSLTYYGTNIGHSIYEYFINHTLCELLIFAIQDISVTNRPLFLLSLFRGGWLDKIIWYWRIMPNKIDIKVYRKFSLQ